MLATAYASESRARVPGKQRPMCQTMSRRQNPQYKPTAFALFAGAGGMSLGLQEAGFDVAVATDSEPASMATHLANWPDKPFLLRDVRRVDGQQLVDLAGGQWPDLVVGGPPCQGFSTIGAKLSSDPRNALFNEFARLVEELSPRAFIMENVRALVSMYGGRFRRQIDERFRAMGYRVNCAVVDAADFGVPQHRLRVLFVGTLGFDYAFPEPTHGEAASLRPWVTVGEAIMDLADKGSEIPSHDALRHGEVVLERYRLIPEGGRLPPPEELPTRIRRKNFGNSYKRLHRCKPALTMVPGNNAFPVHPTLDRSLTPREAARLQTFPDDFVFSGDRRRQCILVGNAVPPLLAREVSKPLRMAIDAARSQSVGSEPAHPAERLLNLSPPRGTQSGSPVDLDDLSDLDARDGFIDLFCGAGGFLTGVSRAGWRPLLSVDNDAAVAKTHAANWKTVPFEGADLASVDVQNAILRRFGGDEIGMIVGGPPCQGFSIFGKRRLGLSGNYDPHGDPRNRLVFSFVALVRELQPRWFVMENVPGLRSLDKGWFLERLVEEFHKAGYRNTEWRVLNAADYGVPQLRRRLLIIGNRTGHVIPWPKPKFFESPRDWQKPWRTVGEVISDLSSPESYERFTCHVPMKHRPLLVERYTRIPEGGRLDIAALPPRLRKGYRTDQVRNYSHIYRRLDRDRPAITMVPGHNAFPVHPWLHRSLTVREAARIQTFPDELEFIGTRQEQCIQVGNGFPPLVAEVIANNIRKAEVNNWFPGSVPKSARYSIVDCSNSATEGASAA